MDYHASIASCFLARFRYNTCWFVQTPNPPKSSTEPSTELLPLSLNDFFIWTFQIQRLAKAFLQVVLAAELLKCLDLDAMTTEETHLTDDVFKNLFADVIYRIPIKDTEHYVEFFVILEHKSSNDFWTILQLWGYVCYVIRREFDRADKAGQATVDYRLPPVIAIIVHHGKSKFTGKTELSELFLQLPGIDKYLPKLQAVLFDLNAISEDDLPDDPDAPELKLVLAALKVVFSKEITAKITDILEELKPIIKDDPVLQDVVRWVWYYLAANAEYMQRDYTLLFETIKTLVEVEAMPTMLERWTAERKDEWIAEGKAEGEARGIGIGEDRKARETALNMKQRGYSTNDIADLTGLSSDEIERLG